MSRNTGSPAFAVVKHISDLILRSALCARLEGWPRVPALCPSFETLASQAPQDEDSISSQALLRATVAHKQNGRDFPAHFHFANAPPHRRGATPGGGGGSDAVPPLSKGVMRRTVTRRLMRLGPAVCFFRYCLPSPCEVRFSAGTWNCCVSNSAADCARRSDSDRLSTSDPTASVWPSIRNTSRGLRWIARLSPSAIDCSFAA